MRKRILGGVVLALSGALLLTALNINFLVRRNKDYLIGLAEQALGRKITVDEIDVTLWPVGARLVNFALADDPAFSADEFLRAKDLRVDLRLLPLLIGRFRLKGMVLESPVITIVRDARGRYNFASYADNKKNDRARADSGKEATSEKQDGTLFLVASLNVSDGTLRYRDLKNSGELTATQINLKVNDFEWDEPFDIQLEAAVMAAEHNLKFKSRVGPIDGNRDYRDVPLDGDIRAEPSIWERSTPPCCSSERLCRKHCGLTASTPSRTSSSKARSIIYRSRVPFPARMRPFGLNRQASYFHWHQEKVCMPFNSGLQFCTIR